MASVEGNEGRIDPASKRLPVGAGPRAAGHGLVSSPPLALQANDLLSVIPSVRTVSLQPDIVISTLQMRKLRLIEVICPGPTVHQ